MSDDLKPSESEGTDHPPKTAELTIAPPAEKPVVADTASSSPFPPKFDPEILAKMAAAGNVAIREQYSREEIHSGPIPDPTTLARFVAIYPEAAKEMFADLRAQGEHRRKLEASVVATNNTLALRGQIIGGVLGGLGLIIAGTIAAYGQGAAGFGVAVASLGSLVAVFIFGKDSQKKELTEKSRTRDAIEKGEPIEKVEE